jgi:hypothetical protein
VPTNGNKVLAMQGILPALTQEEVDGSAVLAHPSELALPGDEPMPSHQAWPNSYEAPVVKRQTCPMSGNVSTFWW